MARKWWWLLLIMLLLSGCASIKPAPAPQIPLATRVMDHRGQLIASFAEENRVPVPLDQVSATMQNAILAIEDSRFYQHGGFDLWGLLRAAWLNLMADKVVAGGSTLTQQLAKNLYLTSQRTFQRKLAEAILTIQLERTYTKNELLEMYLNQVYFGSGAYGIEVASQIYFGKTAAQLSLAESALIAGLPRAPSIYSPYRNPEGALQRRSTVLQRMASLGMIEQETADKAAALPLQLAQNQRQRRAHFVMAEVLDHLNSLFPEDTEKQIFSNGLTITTTIDLDMQLAAEAIIRDELADHPDQLEVALVAIDPANGAIRAMVGGRNFGQSQFNRATQARRQPGSAMKPFLFTAALSRGYTQASTLTCEPVYFPQPTGEVYAPTDYGSKPFHYRPLTLRRAVQISDNIVAIRLNQQLGPQLMVDYAHQMGIKSQLKPYLSLALGTSEVTPLELASAYATLAAGGLRFDPLLIMQVSDRRGKVLERNRFKQYAVLDPAVAYLVTDMLQSVLQPGGTASHLAKIITRPAAGKTGTTQEFKDAWFAGYTPELAAAVYLGYDDPQQKVGIAGGQIAGPIWARFLQQALATTTTADWQQPANVLDLTVCGTTGLRVTPYCPEPLKLKFIMGTEPSDSCYLHLAPSDSSVTPEPTLG